MNRDKAAERLVWAVGLLDVQPDDRLLEVGCGHGVAVSLVCDRLARGEGHITAIDRSATMVEMASRRNADHVRAGLASFRTASLHDADLGSDRFDKVFAIHVPVLLRGDPAREIEVLKRHLAPRGLFFLPFQPHEPRQVEHTIKALSARLVALGLWVVDTPVADLSAARAGCVIASADGPRPVF
ncbi:MAG TPA: class I SAM-dependent methyltransferase [Acidimicrobiales bacterium]|jgi:ubiquinone/menaquinone biosynthesis C-methylase UbiE|nr:class I SAM-dependent methyltransferase [Acidimicrobiales bacterium]